MTEQGFIGPRSNAGATMDFDRYNPQNWGNTKEEGRKLGQLVADAGRRMSTGRSFMDDAMPQAIEAGILGLVEEKSEEFQEGFQEGLSQAYGSRYNSSAPPDELFGRAQGWPGAPMPPGTPGVPMPSMPR